MRQLNNPWHPMSDPVDIKHLGKLAEECNELGSAIARCLIQGIDECEPDTGKPNRIWLMEEMADVMAGIDLCAVRFQIDVLALMQRTALKKKRLQVWHERA